MKSRLSALRLLLLTMSASQLSAAEYPLSSKQPMSDSYHGVAVSDDYRWLEASGTPAVRAWTEAQNHYTRRHLDGLPEREVIAARLTALFAKDTPSHSGLVSRPGRLFALKFQPPKQQRLLVTLASADNLGSEKVVLDPNEMEPKGQVALDWYVPSPDGKLLAVSLSEHGSEEGTLYFYRTDTGERLAEHIGRVQYPTGGGSAAWSPDGQSLFYTRYPLAGEKPAADLNFFQQIYCHRLGTPVSSDTYAAGRDFPRIAEIDLHTSRDGRWLMAQVANGDGGEFAHYLHDFNDAQPTSWRQMTRFEDGIKQIAFGCDGASLYLRSVKDAPRGKILRLALDGSQALHAATLIVPESAAVIEHLTITSTRLFVTDLIGGPSRIRQFDLAGKNLVVVALPETSGVDQLLALKDRPDDDCLLFRETSYTQPSAWMRYDPAAAKGSGSLTKTALFNTSPVDFSDIEAVREFAVSKDGTKIPLNILRRKGTPLDGRNPTLLTGYGGYGISLRPGFNFSERLWFDHGGVTVIANLRGGGEYGEEWHLAGNLTHKQNVFDDFAACAQHLIERGYTRPEKLAVEGGSNGGLLMGAFLTQHPDLARAVVTHVGIYDMLRVELDPNGAFNITEFGSVKDAAQFRAIHAYSPYHHVSDTTAYPAVFFLAGENDGRVNPAHSRKMCARLQAASSSQAPVLIRLSAASGHGMGTSLTERIAEKADVLAFLFEQLGMQASAAAK
ncbi:MAG: S9 family peptidase [Verrucomicrobia bacterium]|nr:MAG: S9 family peptidase [Verrucomicrobiota bacterium]